MVTLHYILPHCQTYAYWSQHKSAIGITELLRRSFSKPMTTFVLVIILSTINHLDKFVHVDTVLVVNGDASDDLLWFTFSSSLTH